MNRGGAGTRSFPPETPIAFVALSLARLPWARSLGRDESAEWQAVSRKTLRHAVPSFTVEVRRRLKRATTSKPDAQLSEARSPGAGFDRASHHVAAPAFEAKKADLSPTEVASSRKGRILPSLVPDESLRRTLQDAAPTPTESDPPPRAPKRPPIRTSKLPRNSRFSSAQNAPVAASVSTTGRQVSGVPSEEGTGVPPRVTATVPNQVVGVAGGLALGAQGQSEEIPARSLATTSGSSFRLTTNDPRQRLTLRQLFPRGSTIIHLRVASEPLWLAGVRRRTQTRRAMEAAVAEAPLNTPRF